MTPKTILITGATDGIGQATAHQLAAQGHRVLLHGRNPARGQAALTQIQNATGNAHLEYFNADLASLRQVRQLAADVQAKHSRLDVLLLNAGVIAPKRTLSEDGFELTFAVNHLAYFLLTHLLLEMLKQSAPARVVVVASQVHHSGQINFNDLQLERGYSGPKAYSNSKLANVLFANELAARLAGTGVTVNSLHPGVINTKLLRAGWGGGGASVETGAATSVYLATSAAVEGVTGKYFSNQQESTPSAASRNPALQKQLWDVSAQMVRVAA